MIKKSKVLALKYRPQVFGDLIGQKIISETISNSIKIDKIPNAYLFTGIRGVGKTTIARIIAKSLNCLNGLESICKENLCQNCSAITQSNHLDVLEMDAASKTGVDDIRDLIEFSRYGPTTAKYKIFIIDEVHMLSKQAFNALLKTLEEPPEYLKFIFATTEIKKIPITVVSRCQRFDLARVKSLELFEFIKDIKEKENGKISDEALKLIVKISEGSVRDCLSLLDRALLNQNKNEALNLQEAQNIFGYFDKSKLIDLFNFIFQGNEKEALSLYRTVYDQGVEPKIFLNDFLEILYYFKNIESLKIGGTNFSLNDEEFAAIKKITSDVDNDILILFWQFTIKTLGELDIVSNQNLSIEMFITRLTHLKGISNISELINEKKNFHDQEDIKKKETFNEIDEVPNLKNKAIDQIKNVIQEKHPEQKIEKGENKTTLMIDSFDELLKTCSLKKEIKLKYELEKNVNLVNFNRCRIEISFNDDLDKDFIKILSTKLYEWTNERWIITLSKEKGAPSKKEIKLNQKSENLEEAKTSTIYKRLIENFGDAELIDVELKDIKND